ncbi:hypothetical protein [Paenibacillus polymyxa]|uniref:hypothetical protein n=1 Tax=Paenibacillus polymyxa TaxID=1406 RepID=UPI0021E38179|nr:hypothetical protein [Paenibacillus polymyxa]
MPDKPRLIDADKLIKQLQDNRDLFAEDKFGSPSYNMGRVDSYHTMITWINNGHFDPDPPQQPDIKLWSKVKHKHHPSWGIGIFQEFSKKKDKALILWPDRKGMFGDRVIGYCQVEKLQKVEGEEV